MMTRAGTEQKKDAGVRADFAAAVLYVCAERGKIMPGLAAKKAEDEGHSFAAARGLRIVDVIIDPYGEPDPQHREGWMRVRHLAEIGAVGTVIVRWPAVIAPDASHEFRHREVRWLQYHGVQVRYSWVPLARGGEVR